MAGSVPALADSVQAQSRTSQSRELAPYLQCVPYARQQSGIAIYGDAHTWWEQAKGRFDRGRKPRVGAVMAFQPHRNMQLGHVAAVSKIIDSRTVLLRHANWSPINGRRGQIENDVRAIDVSPNNDWSSVRVWYDPIKKLGKTAWPIHGFIYSDKSPNFQTPQFDRPVRIAKAPAARVEPKQPPVSRAPSRRFTSAFADLGTTTPRRTVRHNVAARPAPAPRRSRPAARDQVSRAVSLYD
ncbi:CHAP domain-containing protein [Altererythrobacter aquaemixtae]|uniref:CHAP domain-containing protein n=2 Tax=Pontixanthobacter aquaemixtae TaxID=1958940 RepID=A0A844ZPZ5_9SPHN|nr:CHAP domain-containing protein [Pontixanthobacter aquaemixtae]